MITQPACIHLRIFDGRTAKKNDRFAVRRDLGGPGRFPEERKERKTQNVFDDDFGGRSGVGINRRNVAATQAQEAMDLALGMVEAAGTRPAIRASV